MEGEELIKMVLGVAAFSFIVILVFMMLSGMVNNSVVSGSYDTVQDSNTMTFTNGTYTYYSDLDSRGTQMTGCSDVTIYRVE